MWNNSFSLKDWNVDTASSSFDLLYYFQKSNGLIYWWRFSFPLIGALWGFVDALRYMAWKIRAEHLCDCVIVCTFIKCTSCSQNFMLLYLYFGRLLLIEIRSQLLNKMHVSSCSFNMKSVIELEDWMTFSYRDSYIVWSAKRLPGSFVGPLRKSAVSHWKQASIPLFGWDHVL